MSTFQNELEQLINKHSLENDSDSPDFVLAEYLLDALDAYNDAVKKREEWHSRKLSCVEPKAVQPRGNEHECRE